MLRCTARRGPNGWRHRTPGSSRSAITVTATMMLLLAAAAPARAGVPAARSAAPRAGLTTSFGCATARSAHQLHCFGKLHARRAGNGRVTPYLTTTPTGYAPADLQSAYRLAGLSGTGGTVAIVDAQDDSKAESDLAVYRSTFGLPACSTANGCFAKVNQDGQAAPLPAADPGWAEEISLDLDMVSAICPSCHILLVEASSPDTGPLMTAVDTAVRMGATAVSNSYGGAEDSTILAADAHLDHPAWQSPRAPVTPGTG
jgi:hypothetical protein